MGAISKRKEGNHIIASPIEHHAIINSLKYLEKIGFRVSYARVFENGIIDVNKMKINMLSASAHKFGGAKGIGFLYINDNMSIYPYINGGMQERGRRGGTSNVAGIVGMGVAAEYSYKYMEEWNSKMLELRNYLIDRILKKISYSRLNGSYENRLSNNANFSFEGVDGPTLISLLDSKEIYVSGASACMAKSKENSHVLMAMGIPVSVIPGTNRITMSEQTTKEEIDILIEELKKNIFGIRKANRLL